MRTTIERGRPNRSSTPPVERPRELPLPPFRLRFVLFFALGAATVAWLVPRLEATWKVHTLATALADYAACMVGPTGPALLRDRQETQFQILERRRLVTAPAGDAPFERCAELARTITGSASIERAHRAQAFSFAEYGGNPRPSLALSALAVTSEPLFVELHRAWPLVRTYAHLMKPSLGVREAPHPVAPAAPALGRGITPGRAYYRVARVTPAGVVFARGFGANLEVWKSADGGATFTPASPALARDFAERCPAGPDGHFFVLRSEGDATVAVSVGPTGDVSAAALAQSTDSIAAVACDERALVAAIRPARATRATLEQCTWNGPCAALPPPNLGRPELGLDYPLDLARVGGATVVALKMGRLVRVTSSRDGGTTWAPLSVAFDGGEHPLSGQRMPTRLLTVGRRLLLHGTGSRSGESYGLLYSDDQGASFRGM